MRFSSRALAVSEQRGHRGLISTPPRSGVVLAQEDPCTHAWSGSRTSIPITWPGAWTRIEARGTARGHSAKGIQILHDPDQRTAVVIQLFETADDMAAAEGALDEMDPEDTPGTRASIDRCEIKAEVAPGVGAAAADRRPRDPRGTRVRA